MLNGLDLFSGIGGISIALSEWVRPLAYCEIDRYCQGVLLSRMQEDLLSSAPIWDDIRTIDVSMLCGDVDIITGGFPCQDISVAGTGAGLEGERSGLFFEVIRLTRDLRPRFVFLENVPAITVRGLDRILLELTALGYDSRWTIVSAAEVGACHRRERWFLLAHANGQRRRHEQIKTQKRTAAATTFDNSKDASDPDSLRQLQQKRSQQKQWERFSDRSKIITDTDGARLERFRWQESKLSRPASFGGWKSEPTVRRGNHGVSNRVDRIKGLGNAVVPIQAREAFMRLAGLS